MDFFRSFQYALRGIAACIKSERNMRIHIVVAVYMVVFAFFFDMTPERWALLLLTIGSVMSAELVNTAVEKISDTVTMEYHPLIKLAKDVAAGAVLIVAIFAAAIGVFLFWQPDKLWNIVSFLCSDPAVFTLFILTVLLSIIFIVIGPGAMAENAKSLFARDAKDGNEKKNN